MARFKISDVGRYQRGLGGDFFALKGDGDTAFVRFLYNSMEDVVGDAVHQINLDGKQRWVSCLTDPDNPDQTCPLCEAGIKYQIRLFMPLYDVDEEAVKIWERGSSYADELEEMFENCGEPLCSTVIEIQRKGKPGDTNTRYKKFYREQDDLELEDFPEIPKVLGTIILVKTEEEMYYYLENGAFPDEEEKATPRGVSKKASTKKASTKRTVPIRTRKVVEEEEEEELEEEELEEELEEEEPAPKKVPVKRKTPTGTVKKKPTTTKKRAF